LDSKIKKQNYGNIAHKIAAIMVVVALLPLVSATVYLHYYLKDKIYGDTIKNLEVLYRHTVTKIDERINRSIAIAENSAQIPLISREVRKTLDDSITTISIDSMIEKHIKKIITKYNYHDFFIISKKGQIAYTYKKESDFGKNLNDSELSGTSLAQAYKKSSYLLESVMSDLRYYNPSKKYGSFVVSPIIFEDELLGFVAVQLDDEFLFGLIRSEQGLGVSGEIVAAKLKHNGEIVAAVPLKYDRNAFVNQRVLNKDGAATGMQKAVLGEGGEGIISDYRGVKTLAVWGYEPNMGWGIVVKIDEEEILEGINKQTQIMTITLFILIASIVGISIWLSRALTKPVSSLVDSMERFRSDFDHRADTSDKNEIGFLAAEFNGLADEISSQINTLQEQAVMLEEQAAEIEEYSQNLESMVNERTKELQDAKMEVDRYLSIVDRYVITSTTNLDGEIISASEAFCKISGYPKDELIGKKHSILRDPSMPTELFENLWETIKNGDDWSGEICNISKNGERYWVYANISPVFDEDGKIVAYTAIREDITDKKRIEELAITDRLTKIYNRIHLDKILNSELVRSSRYKTPFSVILLDIDKFKSVNDTYGHQVGDSVLKESAKILKNSVREIDTLGRWGGEEFLVIAPNTDLEGARRLAEKLRVAMESFRFSVVGNKTGSFGVSSWREGDSEESLLKRADDALYLAKERGRNRVEVENQVLVRK